MISVLVVVRVVAGCVCDQCTSGEGSCVRGGGGGGDQCTSGEGSCRVCV